MQQALYERNRTFFIERGGKKSTVTGPSGWQGLPELNITFLCVSSSLFVFKKAEREMMVYIYIVKKAHREMMEYI